jgi:hypothetical protein
MASALRLAATRDGGAREVASRARAAGIAATCPFLDEAVVSAAASLSRAERFGAPGSGGWLRSLAAEASPAASSFEPTLDAWLRGPLASWLDATLAKDRLVAQRVWKPDAVAEAVRRWRAGTHGWTARHVFLPAQIVHWLDRDGARS